MRMQELPVPLCVWLMGFLNFQILFHIEPNIVLKTENR
jgi:hypothetical protein